MGSEIGSIVGAICGAIALGATLYCGWNGLEKRSENKKEKKMVKEKEARKDLSQTKLKKKHQPHDHHVTAVEYDGPMEVEPSDQVDNRQ